MSLLIRTEAAQERLPNSLSETVSTVCPSERMTGLTGVRTDGVAEFVGREGSIRELVRAGLPLEIRLSSLFAVLPAPVFRQDLWKRQVPKPDRN